MAEPFPIIVLQSAEERRRLRLEEFWRGPAAAGLDLRLSPVESGAAPESWLREEIPTARGLVAGWGTAGLEGHWYEQADRLEVIGFYGASLKPIDPERAWDRGVQIFHTAEEIGSAVAEYTVGIVLGWLHAYCRYDRALRAGGAWLQLKRSILQRNLEDVTIGLVGIGAIGRQTATLLRALGARDIRGFDPFLAPDRLEAAGIRPENCLEDLFAQCEVVSLHLGWTPQTEGLIGDDLLRRIRPGGLFLNTARGRIVREDELISVLREGHIEAFLDVFAEEPLPLESPLRQLPNVMIAPHAASSSNLTVFRKCAQAILTNFQRWRRGETLYQVVTPAHFALMT